MVLKACVALAAAEGGKPASSLQTDGLKGWRTALERVSVPQETRVRAALPQTRGGKTGSRISSRTAVVVSRVNEEGGAAA